VQAEQERKAAAEARKELRQSGEIDALRGRLRELEANQKEKDEEVKGLRRSLRQKELSLIGSGAPAAGPGARVPGGSGGGALR
jgi:predicted RNase H-like nuclease (RuvC/YqgF family)